MTFVPWYRFLLTNFTTAESTQLLGAWGPSGVIGKAARSFSSGDGGGLSPGAGSLYWALGLVGSSSGSEYP